MVASFKRSSPRSSMKQSDSIHEVPIIQTRKRSRSAKACVSCHNKKIKCDMDQKQDNGICTNCETAQCECVLYVRKKRSANKSKAFAIIEDPHRNNPKHKTQTETSKLPPHQAPINETLKSVAASWTQPTMATETTSTPNVQATIMSTSAAHKPNTTVPSSNSSPSNSYTPSHPKSQAETLKTNAEPDSKRSHLPFTEPPSKEKYKHLSAIKLDPMNVLKENMYDLMTTEFGLNESSNPLMEQIFEVALGKITKECKRSYSLDWNEYEILETFGCFTLPDEKTCWRYINDFFEYINPQFPIVDKQNFYETYSDLTRPPSLLLLYSILFAGAWHANSDYTDTNQQLENVQISKIFFKRARALYEFSIETDPVPLIQSILCFTFNNSSMSNIAKNAYYWSHVAVNVAYQYDFHLKPPAHASPYRGKIQKRLWWLLYFEDRITCFGYSKPSIINLNQSEHDELEMDDLANTGMSQLECLYLMNLIKFGKLLDKIGSVQQEITKQYLNGRSVLHLMKKCDLIMIKYLRNIPKELRFKFNDKSTHSFLALIILSQYYTLLIVTHKANILRKCADIYPSWAISFQAVQMIKMMGDLLISKNMVSRIATISHNSLTTCALIMAYHLLNEDHKISEIAKEFFLRILGIWKFSYRKFPNVYPMLCIFATTYESEEYLRQIVKSVAPGNKTKHPKDSKRSASFCINKDEKKTCEEDPNNGHTESGTFTNEETRKRILQDEKNINLPDLTFFAKSAFNVDGISDPFGGHSPEFEKLGVDFGKLFSESVFTNSSTLLPKLDLKSIIEPQPLTNSHNGKSVTPIVTSNSSKQSLDEFNTIAADHSEPMRNNALDTDPHHPQYPGGDSTNGNEATHTADTPTQKEPVNKAFPEFNNKMQGCEDSVLQPLADATKPQLPVSLWMMHTNWQPKFTVASEHSDASKDSVHTATISKHNDTQIPVGNTDKYNTHSNQFQSSSFNFDDYNFDFDFNGKMENKFFANTYNFMGGFDSNNVQDSNDSFIDVLHMNHQSNAERNNLEHDENNFDAKYLHSSTSVHDIRIADKTSSPQFRVGSTTSADHVYETSNNHIHRLTPSPRVKFPLQHAVSNSNMCQSTFATMASEHTIIPSDLQNLRYRNNPNYLSPNSHNPQSASQPLVSTYLNSALSRNNSFSQLSQSSQSFPNRFTYNDIKPPLNTIEKTNSLTKYQYHTSGIPGTSPAHYQSPPKVDIHGYIQHQSQPHQHTHLSVVTNTLPELPSTYGNSQQQLHNQPAQEGEVPPTPYQQTSNEQTHLFDPK